ncbi:hypothetical protein JCM3775_006341 [Rhodotorula graminis]|uniref:Uncharacterized protein n=1 Tax=Rhodotorula graminis (strain WP1) TaxID=578459 RepID=A0A194SBK2_RHOGW|nr:uncharacterized protein RHOBADRAFT_50618 [Rhodotorula graminis WP1]KPV78108.1 hypothetical protein RHOBADRAFT_50618 [Rhodotorula graminis WP1]
MRPSLIRLALPRPPSEAQRRAKSSMGATIGSFLAVLGVGIGGFFVMKQRNVEKARLQYADRRVKTGALSQMQGGEKIQ